jgi:hypothetical protein
VEHAEERGAVAAQDERTLPAVQHLPNAGGDPQRGSAHLGRADNAGIGVPLRVADARLRLSSVPRLETLNRPGRAERGGRAFLAAARA